MATLNRYRSARTLIARVLGFAQVSGIGLALDVGMFVLLFGAGWTPGYANFASATTAVTFVYFISTNRVFKYQGRFLLPLFLAYLAYQAVAVPFASLMVDKIASLGIMPLVAKGLTLPFTFSANYLFLDFLTRFGR